MKKLLCILTALLMAALLTACGSSSEKNAAGAGAPKQEAPSSAPAPKTQSGKTLVVYFSGTGNTKKLAGNAANVLGADVFEIQPAEPYTSADLNYNDKTSRATREQNDPSARPKIKNKIENFDQYDTVVLAYPIWWGQEPRIIDTFVESYDFSGKTIVPICTSGSSDIDRSAAALAVNTTGAATWKEGKRFEPDASNDTLGQCFQEIGLIE